MNKIKYAELMKELLDQEQEFLDCMIKDEAITKRKASERMKTFKKILKPSRYPSVNLERIYQFMYEVGYDYNDANKRIIETILE